MKLKKLFGLLTGLFLCLLFSSSTLADNVITVSFNTFGQEDGPKNIRFSLKANGEVTVTGVQEAYSADVSSYTLTANTVTIKGDVTEFSCNFNSDITSIDASQCATLKELSCKYSDVTEIKVANLKQLTKLACSSNNLESLDLSGCEALQEVNASTNSTLTTLTLDGCVALKTLEASTTALERLDLKDCVNLETLDVSRGKLKFLNLKNCTSLKSLTCSSNALEELDLSSCKNLKDITCSSNPLAALTIADCPELTHLYTDKAKLSTLTINNCAKLTDVYCQRNELTEINLKNCPALTRLFLNFNKISSEKMQVIVENLPMREVAQNAKLMAIGKDTGAEEGNKCSKRSVATAKEKNWTVYFENKTTYETTEYEGESEFYAVTLEATAGGTLEIEGWDAEALKKVEVGTALKVKATPAEGYELLGLTANGNPIMMKKEFVVNSNTTVKATFEEITRTVQLVTKGPGSIAIEGYTEEQLQKVKPGQVLKVIATPKGENARLKRLVAIEKVYGQEDVTTDILATKQFTSTLKNLEIHAEFEEIKSLEGTTSRMLMVGVDNASGWVTIEGATPLCSAAVYSVEGKLLTTASTDANGLMELNLSQWGKGNYIIRIGNDVVKVALN